MRIITRIIKKEKIKRIYTNGTGWIENFESDIIIDYVAVEYGNIENWIFNKMSILRKDIAIIEWANEIQSEIKQIERVEIKLDEPSDEIPF